MRPASGLPLLVAALVVLDHAGDAWHLSRAAPTPGPHQCLDGSRSLLKAVSHTLHRARQTLETYSCTVEEIDHEDITRDKTSTVKACLPVELAKNESCLASRETFVLTKGSCLASSENSARMALCLSSIYEDLKMYQVEFRALNEKLLMDPDRQILLDEDMLMAIDTLMQALNSSSQSVPQKPSFEEPDFYKTRIKLCILLHAFSIRAVTIDRVMSYLSSS